MGDEKLGSICVWAGICHREDAGLRMPELWMKFIPEAIAGSACACSGWIASLSHKIVDYPMENCIVVKPFVSQEDEVVDCYGHFVCEKFDFHLTHVCREDGMVGFFCINVEVGLGGPFFM